MILGPPSQKLTHPASPGDMPQSSPGLFADCRDLGCLLHWEVTDGGSIKSWALPHRVVGVA